MPCRCDYMEPNDRERELSKVASLLDELDGKPFNKSHFEGYHPDFYNTGNKANVDVLTEKLCSRLQTTDVTKYSLEMQIWWRDHQEADKLRAEKEIEAAATEEEKAVALTKLTPHERRLLGFE